MTPEFAYFLKVNVAFVLLYAFYRLFFYKDTFFKLRRTILLAFFGLSLLYPLMNIQDWVKEQEPMVEVIQIYSAMLPETIITPEAIPETDWHALFISALNWLYWAGVVALLLRFLVQLSSILLLAHQSRKAIYKGIPVYLLNKPAGPFSFFQLIFLHIESHSDKEVDEILAHEYTHVSQWHSIDVILCELICIVCWVNPFVWLLKREVRHNLEYLADDTVLESGYDSKSYQYHLLGLAHHNKSTATIYNSFNVLHLKNRISMMNKKRSPGIGRTKYLVVIPIAGCLMLLSNIDALARITTELAEDVTANAANAFLPQQEKAKVSGFVIDDSRKPVIGANVIIKGTVTGTITDLDGKFVLEAPQDCILQISFIGLSKRELAVKDIKENMKIQLLAETVASSTAHEWPVKSLDESPREQVFTVVEEMPEFPGAQSALLKYLSESIKYPVVAQENGIQGRVSCSFVVQKDGSITDIEVIRGVDPSLDKEAIRVIQAMPKWKPGRQRGKEVAVKYTVPVTFRLEKEKDHSTQAAVKKIQQAITRFDTSGKIYTVVDRMPEFPGGGSALLTYLARNIKYPVDAQENGIQGRVSCSFTIGTDGALNDVQVIRGIDPSLDAEAIRVINSMPKWTPGAMGDMAVSVKYTVPVTFRLQ